MVIKGSLALFYQALAFFDALISPIVCAACGTSLMQEKGQEKNIFCVDCNKAVNPVCSLQLKVKRYTVSVFAAGLYNGPLKKLITAKFCSDMHAAHSLGLLCARELEQMNLLDQGMIDVVVPVPLHWSRHAWRTYNQAEVMAQAIVSHAAATGNHALEVCMAIQRVTYTAYQSRLNKEARDANIQGVFKVKASMQDVLAGKKILIVDDAYTTGATIRELVKVLSQYKPAQIMVMVGARGV